MNQEPNRNLKKKNARNNLNNNENFGKLVKILFGKIINRRTNRVREREDLVTLANVKFL